MIQDNSSIYILQYYQFIQKVFPIFFWYWHQVKTQWKWPPFGHYFGITFNCEWPFTHPQLHCNGSMYALSPSWPHHRILAMLIAHCVFQWSCSHHSTCYLRNTHPSSVAVNYFKMAADWNLQRWLCYTGINGNADNCNFLKETG